MNLIVLGVGRSGTSALTGLLGRMGFFVGEPQHLLQADAGNPRGYWERRDVVYLNREILKAAGADWHRIADLDLGRIDPGLRDGFEERAAAIAAELSAHEPWVLKDPRLCLLLPFWLPFLGSPACLFAYRGPGEVARSMARDFGLPVPAGLALWEGYTLAALRHSQGLKRRQVSHRQLMERPVETLAGIHRDIASWAAWGARELPLPAEEEIKSFIDPALFRNRDSEEEAVTPAQRELFAALEDGSAFASPPPPLSAAAREILQPSPQPIAFSPGDSKGESMSTPVAIRLSRTYDAEALQRDLAAVQSYQKVSQPGPYHNGEWKGLSLYAPSGDKDFAGARRSLSEVFAPTEILDHTPYIRSILDGFDAPKQSVRLLALPPGGVIGEHRDDPIGLKNGVVRLHVPVVTHPDVEFTLGGERVVWGEGELWYGDFSQTHSIVNRSPVTRIHLVMDLEVTEDLLALFPPELVAEQRALGIAIHGRTAELTAEERERYACRFLFPPGVIPYFEQGFEGAVQTEDDRLMIAVAGSPTFVLVPVGGDRFEIVGFGAGIFFQFTFAEGRPAALDLLLDGGEMTVPMTLLPAAEAVAG